MQSSPQVKVIVVGDTSVGKSSILLRFVNNEFNQFHEPTLGAAFLSKVHNYRENKSVRFQVWDTAGQEKYKSIAPIYYRQSQVALCVYDITSRSSFQVLKNWVEELQAKGPEGLLMAIVGNKIDKTDDQKVPYLQAKQYAESINAIFKLTSAKEGKGVNELFNVICERLEQLNQKKKNQQNRQTHVISSKNTKKQQRRRCMCKSQ